MRSHSILLWIACTVACCAAYAQQAEDTPRTRREAAKEWTEDGLEKAKVKGLDVVYARPASSLTGYKKGERNHPTMKAQASSFSDKDIADIAAYLSGLKAK